MYAAEDGENQAGQQGHGDREQRRQDPVKHELYELKKSMAADPHRVQAVHRAGFGDHFLKVYLEGETGNRGGIQSSVMEVFHERMISLNMRWCYRNLKWLSIVEYDGIASCVFVLSFLNVKKFRNISIHMAILKNSDINVSLFYIPLVLVAHAFTSS